MSNKTLIGATLAAVTLAFTIVPTASFAAKKVECYGVKDSQTPKMLTKKACKKVGGSITKPADVSAAQANPSAAANRAANQANQANQAASNQAETPAS